MSETLCEDRENSGSVRTEWEREGASTQRPARRGSKPRQGSGRQRRCKQAFRRAGCGTDNGSPANHESLEQSEHAGESMRWGGGSRIRRREIPPSRPESSSQHDDRAVTQDGAEQSQRQPKVRSATEDSPRDTTTPPDNRVPLHPKCMTVRCPTTDAAWNAWAREVC